MFVQLEDTAVVKTQAFPDRIAALYCRIKRTDPSLVPMDQLPIDVHNQVAVSVVEFLQHLNYLTQGPLRTQRKTFISMTLCSLCEIFNAAGIRKAAHSTRDSDRKLVANAPAPRDPCADT